MGLLQIHRRTLPSRVLPLAMTILEFLEIGAKAWTMTSVNVVPFLEASFPTSPPTVPDVAGENLPMVGYLVSVFCVVSSLEAWLGIPVLQLLLPVVHGGAPSCVVWCRLAGRCV